jgi:hypothetical protein
LCKPFTSFIYRDIKITYCTSKTVLKNFYFFMGERKGEGEGDGGGEGGRGRGGKGIELL